MNKLARPKPHLLLIFALLLLPIQTSFAQSYFELTPSISAGVEYDDNLFLDPANEVSDYITRVSPGLSLTLLKQDTQLELAYTPTFVWYTEATVDNTVNHSGTLTFGQDLTEHLRFDLTDTALRSDDPLQDPEDQEGIRETRNQYFTNNASTSLRYLFGPENALTVGYGNSYVNNDDKTLNDSRTQSPSATLTHRFDVKNSAEINYRYTKADFWIDDIPPSDDYTGHAAGVRYSYNFTLHTTGSLGYNLTTRDFDGNTEDYKVHDASIGLEHTFSPDLSAAASAGYFKQDNDYSDDDTGYTYNASLTQQFERGSINIGGSGGWEESYLETDRSGFSKYWSVNAAVEYQALEPLTLYAAGSYRHNKDADDTKWETTRGNCGLSWTFLRWFSLSLDYSYAERNDDLDLNDYNVNRVALFLTAGRLYRW
jgi:hypothetical protein